MLGVKIYTIYLWEELARYVTKMSVEMMEKSLSASDCPACWEELGDNRIPYSLTCGHTLCFKCIKRLAQNSSRFGCPLCREIVPLTSVKVILLGVIISCYNQFQTVMKPHIY